MLELLLPLVGRDSGGSGRVLARGGVGEGVEREGAVWVVGVHLLKREHLPEEGELWKEGVGKREKRRHGPESGLWEE